LFIREVSIYLNSESYMKKRKINLTDNAKDEELFEPAMLISLEN
jgi:hypothetical protein